MGSSVLPTLLSYLIQEISWKYTLAIYSIGLLTSCTISGYLLRPLRNFAYIDDEKYLSIRKRPEDVINALNRIDEVTEIEGEFDDEQGNGEVSTPTSPNRQQLTPIIEGQSQQVTKSRSEYQSNFRSRVTRFVYSLTHKRIFYNENCIG